MRALRLYTGYTERKMCAMQPRTVQAKEVQYILKLEVEVCKLQKVFDTL